MSATRDELKRELQKLLNEQPGIVAAWEGGAAATGFLDRYSDLDLSIVINEGKPDEIFTLIDEFFETRYGILNRLRMPEPTWHGFSQCFYQLDGFPPLFYCDIVVIPASVPHKFTEPDRHGHSVIWFDKVGIHSAEETPPEVRKRLVNRIYRTSIDLEWLFLLELQKALARKNWLAAQRCYLQFINRHLVPLLNIKYRPAKADFGMRYAEREYPPDVVNWLTGLLKITSVEDIETRLPSVVERIENLKNELPAKEEEKQP
jgi:hypothetical protein